MNKCTRSAFLDDISINILKIVDNIVLLTLNKRRHLFNREVYDYTWIKYLQTISLTKRSCKLWDELRNLLNQRIFCVLISLSVIFLFFLHFFCGPHYNKIFGITISTISLEKEYISDNSINQCHFCAYNFFPWFRRLQTFGAFRFTEMYASLIGNDSVTYQRRLSKEKLFQTEDVLK